MQARDTHPAVSLAQVSEAPDNKRARGWRQDSSLQTRWWPGPDKASLTAGRSQLSLKQHHRVAMRQHLVRRLFSFVHEPHCMS